MQQKINSEEQAQIELGKKLQQFYASGYVNKKQALLFSFYKGIASGFGVIIGGTILIALLIWILSQFGQVPILGHFVDSLRHTIDSSSKSKL